MVLNSQQLLRSTLLVGVITVAAWTTPVAETSIRLHDQAGCSGSQVLLADVAELNGDQAEMLGKMVVSQFSANADHVIVTMDALRRLLRERNLNLATISLSGYSKCRVVQLRPLMVPFKQGQTTPLVANSIDEIDFKSPATLRDRFVQWFSGYASIPGDELQFRFTPEDAKVLRTSVEQQRFEFAAGASSLLGRLTITIGRYRDGQLADTFHIRPFVTHRLLAVVVTQKVKRGQTLTLGNVRLKQITLDRNVGLPVRTLDDVVGMVARSVILPGTVLLEQDIRRPYLVRKGELVTVRCVIGGLVIRTAMRSTADGSLGDVIKVRNERAHHLSRRQGYTAKDTILFVRITGQRQTQTVDVTPRPHALRLGSGKS